MPVLTPDRKPLPPRRGLFIAMSSDEAFLASLALEEAGEIIAKEIAVIERMRSLSSAKKIMLIGPLSVTASRLSGLRSQLLEACREVV